MHQGRPVGQRGVHAGDHERRRGHVAADPQPGAEPLRQRGLAGAQLAREHHDVAGPQHGRQRRRRGPASTRHRGCRSPRGRPASARRTASAGRSRRTRARARTRRFRAAPREPAPRRRRTPRPRPAPGSPAPWRRRARAPRGARPRGAARAWTRSGSSTSAPTSSPVGARDQATVPQRSGERLDGLGERVRRRVDRRPCGERRAHDLEHGRRVLGPDGSDRESRRASGAVTGDVTGGRPGHRPRRAGGRARR